MAERTVNINGYKLDIALLERELTAEEVSASFGRGKGYIRDKISRGQIPYSALTVLEKMYGIDNITSDRPIGVGFSDKVRISPNKLKNALFQKGIPLSQAALEIGLSESYFTSHLEEEFSCLYMNRLRYKYGITLDMVKPNKDGSEPCVMRVARSKSEDEVLSTLKSIEAILLELKGALL